MRKNPNVIGVKNSSMPVQDIQMFKQAAGPDYIIFNGPDEQFMSGRVIGAEGAIGGTYGAMPELYLKLDEYVKAGEMEKQERFSMSAMQSFTKCAPLMEICMQSLRQFSKSMRALNLAE